MEQCNKNPAHFPISPEKASGEGKSLSSETGEATEATALAAGVAVAAVVTEGACVTWGGAAGSG